MPILDKFKDMGTVVMGKVESGSIREGDSLLVMPNKVVYVFFCCSSLEYHELCSFFSTAFYPFLNVTNLQDHVKVVAIFIDENRVNRAGPGENLRVRLSGVEEDILSGFVLSSTGKLLLDF